ncbi:hypothetical protein [Komagataeibacter saccharivorans]|uniref:hypothetical protein n=1 Tax=Komagataeibacter saccharivorans TaxID=265959 RepID=UPI001FB616DE|nr:hypothetical protein [Komagataeibacter saccharivorans]
MPAREQRHTDDAFNMPDLLADSRLGHAQFGRSGAETAQAPCRFEHPHIAHNVINYDVCHNY